ncbi:OprD family porin [Photobacterium leiognathi]|uniref:Porin n=1 Tax=Photobacterium leiognathi subsp. mandapamensis TaxID=48408 RepID=A0A2T3L0K9_PHOLD|nr:porin [Photobacterium leiognathi]PSV13901.1 porin [Photobacterium leiognathi subsp. mandapamensis]
MESKFFKVSALTAAMLGAVAMPAMATEDSAAGPEYVEQVNEFLEGSTLAGVAVVDTRSRTRSTGAPGGKDGDVWSRLNYSSYNLILDFTSGYHNGWLGADIAGYLSGDLYNDSAVNGGTNEYLCNEISACNNLDWGAGEGGPVKITKAALKFKAGENVDGRFGFTQANGNGVLGNVWSFVPGTYRGAELNANIGNFKATYFIADQFTAPWLLSENDYAPALWADTSWGIAHSLGLQGNATDDLFLQFGLGQVTDVKYQNGVDWANGVVTGYHDEVDTTGYKVYARYNINDTMSLAYDFYGVNDDVQYDGLGYTTGLAFNASFGQFSWMTNLNYAKSDNDRDVNPRMIYTYGMTNGTYSLWWDALSDWNKSGEVSIYNRLSFDQGNGWNYYLGFGYGSGGKSAAEGAKGDWDYESEYAVNGTISYSVQSGALKGSTVRLHGTVLERDEYEGAASADETDLRFQVIIPYTF